MLCLQVIEPFATPMFAIADFVSLLFVQLYFVTDLHVTKFLLLLGLYVIYM